MLTGDVLPKLKVGEIRSPAWAGGESRGERDVPGESSTRSYGDCRRVAGGGAGRAYGDGAAIGESEEGRRRSDGYVTVVVCVIVPDTPVTVTV